MLWKCIVAIFLVLLVSLGFYAISNKIKETPSRTNSRLLNESPGGAKKRHKQHVPKFMLDLYHQNVNGTYFAGPDIIRSVVPKKSGFVSDNSDDLFENKHLLIFELPGPNKDETFISAELKILSILENPGYNDLERAVKISIFDDLNGDLIFLDKLRLCSTNNSWLSFNLTAPVHFLLQKNTTKHIKVIISIKSMLTDGFKLSLTPKGENFEHDYPVLLLSYNSIVEEDKPKIGKRRTVYKLERTKRNTFEDEYEEDTNNLWDDDNLRKNRRIRRMRNTCRKKPLYVDFSEINYDTWIVQPTGYEAFQCQGKCFYPVAEHLSPTKHAIVQALVHSLSPGKASRSCCVPTKLDSISVLYIDNIGVLTYRYAYKDMVVVECGCR